MTYQCELEMFEGPLDLLLHLIKEEKMDIYDIPIAQITRQYFEYLDIMRELNLDVVGEYLIMAAELTKLKSKMLLPIEPKAEQEEVDPEHGEDPREELARRLLEYRRYKGAAFELRKREYDQQQLFYRGSELEVEEAADEPMVDANIFDLLTAFRDILKKQTVSPEYEIKVTTLSVSDRIEYIMELLNMSESISFDSLFTQLNTRQEIIVTFLATLELMRMQLIRIQQAKRFGVIRIYAAADKETQEKAIKQFQSSEESESNDLGGEL